MSFGVAGFGTHSFGNTPYGSPVELSIPPSVTITDITKNKISDEIGFDSTTISWYSNDNGTYQVEIGGTGVGFGYLVESSNCASGVVIDTIITDDVLEDADPVLSDGVYRLNIYVTDQWGNTTPYSS